MCIVSEKLPFTMGSNQHALSSSLEEGLAARAADVFFLAVVTTTTTAGFLSSSYAVVFAAVQVLGPEGLNSDSASPSPQPPRLPVNTVCLVGVAVGAVVFKREKPPMTPLQLVTPTCSWSCKSSFQCGKYF